MKSKNKPHIRLTPQGWHAKLRQYNAIGKSPQEAIKSLNEFLGEQQR
ncbi:TPA: hypothetical protein RG501_RS15160 [Providencia rettgeri]|nr:hypothetical protein [Providencia rettgeri]